MIETQTYFRKPVPVQVLQVTDANIRDVARWCGGKIQMAKKRGNKPAVPYIQVQVLRAMNDRHTKAFVGDWVLFMDGAGFKVFPDEAFHKAYEPAKKDETDELESVKHEVAQALDEFGKRIHDMTVRLNGDSSGRV
jgi:hypothetical protein